MKKMIYQLFNPKAILYKGSKDGYKIAIISYGLHPCAYIGIPKTHKYFGVHYDNYDVMPIDCHGGLTFSEMGLDIMPWVKMKKDKELWWIGWDYSHCDDYSPIYEWTPAWCSANGKKWKTTEIYRECLDVIEQLKKAEKHD